MKEQETLSDKRIELMGKLFKIYSKQSEKAIVCKVIDWCNLQDKEFIKKLKETFVSNPPWSAISICEEIDKLAGDKLT